jgi:hypothetical protein
MGGEEGNFSKEAFRNVTDASNNRANYPLTTGRKA